ncbi:hypothetical protein BDZ89DRAFT_1092818 [Hymenopellis radicata]|nr:hypothetical protein BDZ89DRAFT_1092818 [Hymenopellis radicata]
MYHDKRFQKDPNFPFAVFSHHLMKQTSSAGFLLTEKPKFDEIIIQRMSDTLRTEGTFKPITSEEKDAYQVIRDLDLVAGKVDGSLTGKKYARNELWSLMMSEGAPTWYVTLTPSDFNHPLCFYWATEGIKYELEFNLTKDARKVLVLDNPVAGARFFNFMVEMFIKHILGVDGPPGSGVFGDVSYYYANNEEQGLSKVTTGS